MLCTFIQWRELLFTTPDLGNYISGAILYEETLYQNATSLNMSLEQYSDELKETADKLTRAGYGLLACDESTGTVGTRLEGIGMENSEENRRDVSPSQ